MTAKPPGSNPGKHRLEHGCRRRNRLGDRDLRRLRLELLDPAAQRPDVGGPERADGCTLEMMTSFAGFDEENPGLGPGDREREPGESRS